ncbi:molybdenum ABC transporter ATP-binding protein [Sedimentitalea nanhaiensis]|uniref:Molybdate transport system ATP-binding protein n=1 Tax=Sedimentitalea nanhaiensis TaxID=999627 RepID=A0A1I6Y537_9RHOB|nr:molybdenum ABC transporter ATP-binding protein [Sedimentitalea nanhaiensis]SFT45254.1 molybdate transport system ATP-binding protein [Sedimentitalea nanhaiensis]
MSLSVDIRHRLGTLNLHIAFQAPTGITALFGQSGTGKTTVVDAVAGLLRPESGHIELSGQILFDSASGRSLPVHRRRLGYVFQDGRLFPHMSVRQNLTYGQRFAALNKGPSLNEVTILLGLNDLLDRRPGKLSGGEKQRVAIGRALLSRPRMLLMDEPLAALDSARKAEILPYLERLRDQTDIPILYVSHSVAEVARLATTVVVLEAGRVVRAGRAEVVLSDPDMVRQLGVREAGAVLSATVRAHHADGLTELAFSGGRLFLPRMNIPERSPTRVRILAQDVLLSRVAPMGLSALNILPVHIIAIREGSGPGVIVQIQSGQDRLLARITRRSADAMELRTGDAIYAVIKSVSIARTDIGAG